MKLFCPYCTDSIKYDHLLAGKSVICKYCKRSVVMPLYEQLTTELQEQYSRENEKIIAKRQVKLQRQREKEQRELQVAERQRLLKQDEELERLAKCEAIKRGEDVPNNSGNNSEKSDWAAFRSFVAECYEIHPYFVFIPVMALIVGVGLLLTNNPDNTSRVPQSDSYHSPGDPSVREIYQELSGTGPGSPYEPGEPGFESLDDYPASNKDKAKIRDAVKSFQEAEKKRKRGW